MVPKFLVPDHAPLSADSAGKKKLNGPTQAARMIIRESEQTDLAPRKKLFAEAMLEDSPTRPPRRVGDFVVSAMVQVLFLAMLLLIPLYFSNAIDAGQFKRTLLVAPLPAPVAPPPLASARSVAPSRRVLSVAGKLVMPRVIPNRVPRPIEEPSANDLAAAIDLGAGVPGGIPGGVPGGQPGGVIGGALSGPAPPPPIDSKPKGPIRVGRGVKAPRLIFGPNPVYPLLARQGKLSGVVVIDAVINAQGNVVEMRTVSGHPILALAAMEALSHWKYEPTILGGEAIPVELLVTLTFASIGPQA